MLHADVGHVAVVDGVRALVRHPHHDFLDVCRFDLVLEDEIAQRIEGRLDRRAHRPALDVRIHDLVVGAESASQHRGIRLAAVGHEEAALTREHVIDTRETMGDHRGCRDAVACRHAAEVECLFNMLPVTHPARDARRLLGGE